MLGLRSEHLDAAGSEERRDVERGVVAALCALHVVHEIRIFQLRVRVAAGRGVECGWQADADGLTVVLKLTAVVDRRQERIRVHDVVAEGGLESVPVVLDRVDLEALAIGVPQRQTGRRSRGRREEGDVDCRDGDRNKENIRNHFPELHFPFLSSLKSPRNILGESLRELEFSNTISKNTVFVKLS